MKMRTLVHIISLCTISALIAGCASVINGSKESVSFKSTPDQADLSIYNKKGEKIIEAKTPTVIELKRGDGYFKKAGYRVEISTQTSQPQEVTIKGSVDGWYVGNVLLGGLIGLLIVDPLTGGMWNLSPDEVDVVLQEVQSTVSIPEGQPEPTAE